jgi:hypothetical protein
LQFVKKKIQIRLSFPLFLKRRNEKQKIVFPPLRRPCITIMGQQNGLFRPFHSVIKIFSLLPPIFLRKKENIPLPRFFFNINKVTTGWVLWGSRALKRCSKVRVHFSTLFDTLMITGQ